MRWYARAFSSSSRKYAVAADLGRTIIAMMPPATVSAPISWYQHIYGSLHGAKTYLQSRKDTATHAAHF